MTSALIDSKLFIKHELTGTIGTNENFGNKPENKAHFATDLLLYDQVIIPTHDFGIIPILIDWLGIKTFLDTIDTNSLSFLHRHGLLGYAGNGNGVGIFIVQKKDFAWWQKALFGEKEIALEAQLTNVCSFITPSERNNLIDKISAKTKIVEYPNDLFIKNVAHESYLDILGSEELKKFVIKLTGKPIIDLTRLVEPNQLKTPRNDGLIKDAADLVLQIAEINFQIIMSTQSENADILTSEGSELILKNKLARAGINKTYIEGFFSLLDLNRIPNIDSAISKGLITLSDVWDIRQKNTSKKFRRWLKRADTKDARELERLYNDSLGMKPLIESLPFKTVRFVITTAVGTIEPISGVCMGAVDSFFIDKWLKGFSPKLFIDQLRKLPL